MALRERDGVSNPGNVGTWENDHPSKEVTMWDLSRLCQWLSYQDPSQELMEIGKSFGFPQGMEYMGLGIRRALAGIRSLIHEIRQ